MSDPADTLPSRRKTDQQRWPFASEANFAARLLEVQTEQAWTMAAMVELRDDVIEANARHADDMSAIDAKLGRILELIEPREPNGHV